MGGLGGGAKHMSQSPKLVLTFERRFRLEALVGFEDPFEEELGDGDSSDRAGASWSWSDGEAWGNIV